MQFNFIAKYYTLLSKLVFGTALETAKISLFYKIPNQAKVLFIGGGAGNSLKMLLLLKPNVHVDFVEVSEQMMARAKKQMDFANTIKFINAPIEEFKEEKYDVVITEFFFDLFTKENIQQLIPHIVSKLNADGCWIDTDFRLTAKLTQRVLLKIMYVFFNLTAGLKTLRLVDLQQLYPTNGFTLTLEKKYKKGFVSSRFLTRRA